MIKFLISFAVDFYISFSKIYRFSFVRTSNETFLITYQKEKKNLDSNVAHPGFETLISSFSTCYVVSLFFLFFHFSLSGKLVEKTMMRKYGVENVSEHFICFNTICDATQVNFSNINLQRNCYSATIA